MNVSNQRELLELAAKACGYDTSHRWNKERLNLDPPVASLCIDTRTAWNPLENDDDAFRLAIELGITVVVDKDTKTVEAHYGDWDPDTCSRPFVEEDTVQCSELYAARLAVVRAAAVLGDKK